MQVKTLRIELSYQGWQIKWESSQLLEHVPPPPDYLGDTSEFAGCWYELRDEMGDVIYRKVIVFPLQFEVEVPTGNVDHPWEWHYIVNPAGSFFLDMPDFAEAKWLVLVNLPINLNADVPRGEIFSMNLWGE